MTSPLVVGTDGSDTALEAVDWAADEAALRRLPLRIVHASLWERYEGKAPSFALHRPEEQILAEHMVNSAQERARLRRPDLEVSAQVLAEDVPSALVREGTHATALWWDIVAVAAWPACCSAPSDCPSPDARPVRSSW